MSAELELDINESVENITSYEDYLDYLNNKANQNK